MPFWIALASSAFCGWFAGWLSFRLAYRRAGPANSLHRLSPMVNRVEVSSGWPLAASLMAGLLLSHSLAAIFPLQGQSWWPGVYFALGAGTLVAYVAHWFMPRWLEVGVPAPYASIIPSLVVAMSFGCAIAITQVGGSTPPVHLLLAALLVGGLLSMMAVDGGSIGLSSPVLGATFLYGLTQVIAGSQEAPMAASVVAGAIVSTMMPLPNARVRPIPFWGQSALIVFIASDAVYHGAWVALALSAITAVGLTFLVGSFGFVRGTLPMPPWSFWASAVVVLGIAAALVAIHSPDGPMAVGVGLSVLIAGALLLFAASRDVLAGPNLATAPDASRPFAALAWSYKELSRGIRGASTCNTLWQLVLRSHTSAGLVSVRWQLPGLCFETAAQEQNSEKHWMISIPLAPSAWIEAEWDPSLQISLNEATHYLTSIAQRAAVLTIDHIETLFGDGVDSDAVV